MEKNIKNKLGLALVFSAGILMFAGCTTEDNFVERTVQSNVYSNTSIGLSITFPQNWLLKSDEVYGKYTFDIFGFGAPIDNFSPNVSVLIQAHSGATAMEEILPNLLPSLQKSLPDVGNYRDTIYTINGKQIGQIEFESSSHGTLNHFLEMFFINKGKDMMITFTDRASHFAVNQEFKSVKSSISINAL